MEKIDYLIEYLLNESGRKNFDYSNRDKKSLYRALVNVRQANPISEDFLKTEDEYLQKELEKKNITNVNDIKTIKEKYNNSSIVNSDKICLWQGDITKLKIDSIVNSGNSQGLGCFIPNHNCIDNQINTFAGVRLRIACNEIMKKINYNLETGKAIITKGYNLAAKYVIQTVGPIIENEVTNQKEIELANCYKNSLQLAIDNGIRTIAFPCISTGVFRFPKTKASQIAIKSVDEFINENKDKIDKVVFNLWEIEDVMIYEQNIK
ncbi:MAG: protein-ADP-ribose hydrolase [Clostridia bacterium]|nr:protein-ADP-ribose hydrolase [Clostridia bacterium]